MTMRFSTVQRGVTLLLCLIATESYSQTAPSTSLTDVAAAANFNALERAAAGANQATFNRLNATCGDITIGCSASELAVFNRSRELVQSANELLGAGATQFSLGVDAEGLGFALRWTAAEEYAAQGAATTKFAASQLSALATRVAVLRWGVTGLRKAGLDDTGDDEQRFASSRGQREEGPQGGGASSDLIEGSRWGSFMDGNSGFGLKDPTALEDAFDFEGTELTIGLDRRFSPSFVAGAIFGYSDKLIDFDSSRSVVDGNVDTTGLSAILFGLLEGDHPYLTVALGFQSLTHDTVRRINYPSFNPNVLSVNSEAKSRADSSSLLAALGGGYAFRFGAFAVEPILDITYSHTKLGGFTETSRDRNPNPVADDPFNVRVGEQRIESLDVAPAFKLQYVFRPSIGTLIPYVVWRYHAQLSDDARSLSTRYADAVNTLIGSAGTDFAVSTDDPDTSYYTLAGGVTFVRGNGINAYLQYLKVLSFDNYSDAVVTGGLRFEF